MSPVQKVLMAIAVIYILFCAYLAVGIITVLLKGGF